MTTPPTSGRARTWTIAAMSAIGAAAVLVLSPLVAGAISGEPSIAVVDMRPDDGRLDDARLTAQVTRHTDANLVLVTATGMERLAACDADTPIPRTCAALDGARHVDRLTLAGGDSGYWASVRTAMVIGLLSAAAFFVLLLRSRRRPAVVPEKSVTAPAALPDDVLAAIPQQVTAVGDFGPKGGFVDAGGVLVWAAMIRPGEPVRPGQSLTVLSSSHERDSLLVTLSVPQAARR